MTVFKLISFQFLPIIIYFTSHQGDLKPLKFSKYSLPVESCKFKIYSILIFSCPDEENV